jgi:peptidoglycan-N-acetylglucosamine deacetylase
MDCVAEWEKMKARKPIASLSLDLDNKWSYMKTHNDPGWESFPSYLDVLVPRVLNFLKARNLTVTFFIVGQDAALERNHELLRKIRTAGHEIGNHSFKHDPWLHLYSEEEIDAEIAAAEEHIERATGQRPGGFRAPGYGLTHAVLRVIERRGYRYDASTWPSLVAPAARAYYFMTANFGPEEKKRRRFLGGTLRDGLRPISPYRWRLNGRNRMLIEIPVTTMPIFKLPIHVSYLVGLSILSPNVALRYFRAALKLCQCTGTEPSIVLHPTDFLGCDDAQGLSFIPGMNLRTEQKLKFLGEVLRVLSAEFVILTLQQHAHEAAQVPELRVVQPQLQRHHLFRSPAHIKNGSRS